MSVALFNAVGVRSIYASEKARMRRTVWRSVATPVITTALNFVVFGDAIGSRMKEVGGVGHGAFIVPALVITPLTFLGGAFYSIDMLPQPWRTVSLFNPVVYLVSGFRWSFYGRGDLGVGASLAFTGAFVGLCLAVIAFIFRSGYRLKP